MAAEVMPQAAQIRHDAAPGHHAGAVPTRGPVIQAKLRVGAAGDSFEREADAVAAKVVRALQSDQGRIGVDDGGADLARVRRAVELPSAAGEPVELVAPVQRIQRAGRIGGDDDGEELGRLRRAAEPLLAAGQPVELVAPVQRIQRAGRIGAEGQVSQSHPMAPLQRVSGNQTVMRQLVQRASSSSSSGSAGSSGGGSSNGSAASSNGSAASSSGSAASSSGSAGSSSGSAGSSNGSAGPSNSSAGPRARAQPGGKPQPTKRRGKDAVQVAKNVKQAKGTAEEVVGYAEFIKAGGTPEAWEKQEHEKVESKLNQLEQQSENFTELARDVESAATDSDGFAKRLEELVDNLKAKTQGLRDWMQENAVWLGPLPDIGGLFMDIKKLKDKRTILKGLGKNKDSKTMGDDVMYAFAKVARGIKMTFIDVAFKAVKVVSGLITILSGGLTAIVTESLKVLTSMFQLAKTAATTVKAGTKMARGTRGVSRELHAHSIVAAVAAADPDAIKLLHDLIPEKKIPKNGKIKVNSHTDMDDLLQNGNADYHKAVTDILFVAFASK
jgi:hypothetical protein